MTFLVETMPCEGRNPKIPQHPAGTLTLPPVSVPIKRKMNKKENHHIDFFPSNELARNYVYLCTAL